MITCFKSGSRIYIRTLFLILFIYFNGKASFCQTLVLQPLNKPNISGDFYSNTSIVLLPGFSTKANGYFHAYIAPVGGCSTVTVTPSTNQNFVVVYTPRLSGISNAADPRYTNCQVAQTIQYFDGLGRLMQSVQPQATPAGNDLVQPVAYDAVGRQSIKFLPYSVNSANPGAFRANAISYNGEYKNSEQYNFYQQTGQSYAGSTNPYAQTMFEASVLDRTSEQGAPGASWQVGNGHTVRNNYLFNNNITWANDQTNSRQVALYTAVINSDGTRTLSRLNNTATYGDNQLSVTVVQDENWTAGRPGTTEEYKDNLDRIILKRTYNAVGGTVQVMSTYYVYDNGGELAFVLAPGALPDNSGSAIQQTTLDNLCYQYQYDERRRMTAKKIPGKGWDYIVYNNADQVVATQDAAQRVNRQWTVTKYDALGRIIMTGLWSNNGASITPSALKSAVYTSAQWDSRDPSNTATGYTINSYPQSFDAVLSVNYYDDYSAPGLPFSIPSSASKMTDGLLTASKVAVVQANNTYADMLWSTNVYDELGRITQVYAQHYLSGSIQNGNYDLTTTTYNFNNQVTTTNRQHYNYHNTSAPLLTVNNRYIYDKSGRRLKNWEQITNGGNLPDPAARTLISQIIYNEIGQVASKQLHSVDSVNFMQMISYNYNERGWLTQSNAPLFNEQLQYDNNSLGISGFTAQYNGNIATQSWVSPISPGGSNYSYTYDNINRLTGGNNSDSYNENNITYDLQGNLTSLNRYQGGYTPGLIDQLVYTYNGTNQLQSITDNSDNNLGVKSGTSAYLYNDNGSVKADNSRSTGAIGISYNMLNLPNSITGAQNINYVYDAGGRKIRKQSGAVVTEYVDGLQYDNSSNTASSSSLQFIQTEEGRALPNGNTYNYEYMLTDHLGNSRVSFDQSGGGSNPKQQDDYYPFGKEIVRSVNGTKNEYLYNKKELQEELGQYDYGARFYDPVIGRWTSVDRFSSKYFSYSPYNYANNNPIKNLDLNGDSVNVSQLLKQGVNGFYTLFNMISDLQNITGTELEVNASGNLTITNSLTTGSAKARAYLTAIIGAKGTIRVGVDNTSGTHGGGMGTVSINTDQIDGNIASTVAAGMSELTNGYGISFLHESLHTVIGTSQINPNPTSTIGDPPNTQPNAIGPTETIINTFRNELGLPERNQYFWQQAAGSTSAPTMEFKNKNGTIVTISQGTMDSLEQIKRRARAVIEKKQ